jgi:hypothetical protein
LRLASQGPVLQSTYRVALSVAVEVRAERHTNARAGVKHGDGLSLLVAQVHFLPFNCRQHITAQGLAWKGAGGGGISHCEALRSAGVCVVVRATKLNLSPALITTALQPSSQSAAFSFFLALTLQRLPQTRVPQSSIVSLLFFPSLSFRALA